MSRPDRYPPGKFKLHAARARRSGRRIFIEPLEDRTAPAFLTAPSVPVGPNGGEGSGPVAVAVGDFNRDGRLDFATANHDALGISVLLGKGNGAFAAAVNVPIGRSPDAILARDLNGDGKIDIVTANRTTDSISVLLGTGLGTFKAPVHYSAGNGAVSVAAGDLNADGRLDLAVADQDGSNVTLLFGDGAGRFPNTRTVAAGSNPISVAIGNFNQDSLPDLAIVSGGSNGSLLIKLNNGNGTFASAGGYNAGFVPNAVVVGFFNNDAIPDLAVSCKFPSQDGVGVLFGQGNGTFQTPIKVNPGNQTPLTLAAVDLNGDGVQDIVTANEQFANNSVSVLIASGTGGFAPARVFTAGQGPVGVAAGDFNGDGVIDIVTADAGTPVGSGGPVGTATVLLGNGDGTLAAAPNLVVDTPGPIVAAELTGDGIPDLAVVTGGVSYSGVTVFPGLGDGSFGDRFLSPAVFEPTALAVGDFNGDQKGDLAVTTGSVGGSTVKIMLGNGNGTFGAATTYAVGSAPTWVAVADFNGDTKADLVVANGVGVSVLLGNGDGTFGAATGVSAGGAATYVAAADLNGDGKTDLAVVHDDTANSLHAVSILFGQGNGSFGSPTSYATRVGPGSVGIGYFNGDARPDLAVPTFFGPSADSALAILQNGGNGAFALRAEYATDSRPVGIVVADFTGDGRPDLAVANNFADDVFVFPGTGTGTFGPPAEFVVGDRPTWLAAADFTGDGRPDLAVVNYNSDTVTLLKTPAAVASQFRVNVVPDAATAGVAFPVVVAALDGQNHLLPNYTGSVSFSSTDPKATLPAPYTFTAADHGVHRFNVTLRTSTTADITAHFQAATGTDSVPVVATKANHLKLDLAPSQTAGVPFDVTVTALDRFDNVAPGYRGTVHFSTSDRATGVALPANYTFTGADAGVHTFTGGVTLVTAGSRTVSARAMGTLWPVASASVALGAADASHLVITGPTSATAGTPVAVTVTARDQFGNVATGFTGTVQFTSSDGNADLPTDYAFTPADQGVHTFQPAFKSAGTQSLTVASSGLTSGQQDGILVKPGAAALMDFLQGPTNAFVATPVKPVVTVQVRDAFGNPVLSGVKVTLALANNPTGALLGGAGVYTGAGGIATFKNLTVSKRGEGYSVVAKSGAASSAPSAAFTVYAATHFGVSLSSTQTVAGASITVTVTALDGANQPDATYVGTVHFSSSDVLADLPTDYTFQAGENGQHQFTVTLKRAGLQSLAVADIVKPTVTGTASVTVSTAAVSGFLISGFPLSTAKNVAHTFTVVATDAFGNTVTNYLGTVQFTSTDGAALLPGPYTFTAADKGRHSFTATFQSAGSGQSLTVTDQNDLNITGTLDGITVT